MGWLLVMVVTSILVWDCNSQQMNLCDSDNINFLSFFPCTDGEPQSSPRDCDVFLYPAAQLAVEHINQHPCILRHRMHNIMFNNTLTLIPTGTRGDVHFTTFFHAQHVGPQLPLIHGIIGPDDSVIAERTAYISGNYFHTHMISYGARDPSLSDRQRYPLFFRSLPSGQFLNAGIVALLHKLKWKRVAVLASSEERSYSKTAERLTQLISEKVEFSGNVGGVLHFVFSEILAADLRIIIGLFSPKAARNILCQARMFRDGSLTDANHVWILPSYYDPEWWRLADEELERCSNQDMVQLLESVLFVDTFNFNITNRHQHPSNLTLHDFHEQLLNRTAATHPALQDSSNLTAYLLHSHATAAYDAVWSLAMAWNLTTPKLVFEDHICNNTLPEVDNITARLKQSLQTTRFCGFAGLQRFDVSHDSYGQILISQFINGGTQPVGIFQSAGDGSGENLTLEQFIYLRNIGLAELDFIKPALGFQWKGRSDNTPPSDGVIVEHSEVTLPALGVVTGLTLLVVVFAMSLLVLNICCRKNRHIKASSPRLNVLIIAGFMLVPPSAVLRGLTHSREAYGLSVPLTTALCQVDLHVTNTALTVAIATLFAKNWRIYCIFHNHRMQTLSWMLSDNGLLFMVFLVTLPFVSLLVIWQLIDPVVASQQTFVRSQTSVLEVSGCGSQSFQVWLWLCIGYTALLMVALLVVSFHNSSVASHFMEEGSSTAKFAILNLLLILPALFLTSILVELESSLYTLSFWLSAFWVVVLPAALLAILYIPKICLISKDHRDKRKQMMEERKTTVMRTRLHSLHEESSKLKLDLEERQSRVRLLSQSSFMSPVSASPPTHRVKPREVKESQLQSLVDSRRLKETKTTTLGDDKTLDDR